MMLIPMWLSLSVHEWAHAWSALKLGDDTAAREGRLTLNPLSHIDPIGTVLLPLFGIPLGWAKPVPVNPVRFNRKWTMRTGMAITAFAGPLSNVVLAVGCAVALGLIYRFVPSMREVANGGTILLGYGVQLNIGLAIFNMLPLPPLDGSRIVDRMVTPRWEATWDSIKNFGPFLLFFVFASGGYFLSGPISAANEMLRRLIGSIAGVELI
ncbi:MAG: site-2 protease family protein [Archangium sp.]